MNDSQHNEAQDPIEQNTTSNTEPSPPADSLFKSGGFVIALIVFGLFATMITWSVSFLALFFGAIGALLSVATCLMDHSKLAFRAKQDVMSFEDENWAYLAMRAVFGMIFGTAVTIFVHINVSDSIHWSGIAVLALFGGFIFDRLAFKSAK